MDTSSESDLESATHNEQEAVLPIAEQVKALPQTPGVYRFFDVDGKLLYVGKAIRLRSRVQSYFREAADLSPAKQRMVHAAQRVEVTLVDTEEEALLLETTLIKRHKPPYNILMKDDKNFQYIHITADTFPQIETIRTLPLPHRRSGYYFGPYTSGYAVKQVLRSLKMIFKYCENPPIEKSGEIIYPKRPCLQYQMGRCIGPCAKVVTPKDYQQIFEQIRQILAGEIEAVQHNIEELMQAAVSSRGYEKAAQFRDQLGALNILTADQKVVDARGQSADMLSLARTEDTAAINQFTIRHGRLLSQHVFLLKHVKGQSDEDIFAAFTEQWYTQALQKPPQIITSLETRRGKNRKLLEMGHENAMQALESHLASFEKEAARAKKALAQLAAALQTTPEKLHRIEVYDISHNQGAYTVASMIVFVDGRPAPSEYRKFKIRSARGTGKSDDFASMREVINRRVKHIKRKQKEIADPWKAPNLIVIDGGKGQLSSAKAMLDVASLDIPIISLAKRIEEIFLPENSTPILLPRDSEGLYLMQRMRDEAHRFAIGFYRKRHLAGLV